MTTNSIGYITKRHFHSGSSIFTALIAVAVAGVSAYLSVMNGFHLGLAAFAGFSAVSALFTVISLFSVGTGCTLMRISIAVNALACFFAGMGMFTLGYLFIRHSSTQNHINTLLAELGLNTIATPPNVTGAILFIGSVILYLASGCAFFGHRYLGAARTCASGKLRRSGFRVFPLLSFILFICVSVSAAVFLHLLSETFTDEILSDRFSLGIVLLMALLLLHLLFSGLCARAFARKSFAFKVFEKQVMKVETNADGTVYVPINEDKAPDEEEPLLPTKKHTRVESHSSGKQFIKEFEPAGDDSAARMSQGEGDIL